MAFDNCRGGGRVWRRRAAWAFAGALLAPVPLQAGLDPAEILKASDRARGGGLPGIVWTVHLSSLEEGRSDERQLLVQATAASSLAEVQAPARHKGSKLLQIDRNMWMTRPGLRKPIPISPRQKLSGQAAQGDVASTNYAFDYDAVLKGEEAVDGEECYVLDLEAKNRSATYDRVVYWVSKRRLVGVKAELRSVSGKLMKTAVFAYGNEITHEGRRYPFVSKMTIVDALSPGETTLTYSDVRVERLSPGTFALDRLGE